MQKLTNRYSLLLVRFLIFHLRNVVLKWKFICSIKKKLQLFNTILCCQVNIASLGTPSERLAAYLIK